MQRRSLLQLSAATLLPNLAFARAQTDSRFILILQRGAADGLHTLAPYADPAYARLRGALAEDATGGARLDGTFALHPALAETAKLYAAREALFVHAVALPYRERSHFDAQNLLESGANAPYGLKDGWLNRLLTLLPPASTGAIALAPTLPLALRGPVEVASYAPSGLPQASDDLLLRVGQLYAQDEQLHAPWTAAMDLRAMAADDAARDPAALGRLAAEMLARADGPRIAMLETGGWDTHSAQSPRLARQLRGLDGLLAALHSGLGAAWARTTVLVATEFGRTAAANGTGGTDHGSASLAWLAGGAVRGGRIVTDWPGLAPAALLDGRDLRPTTSLHALIAGATAECFGLDAQRVARTLFPQDGTDAAAPVTGLLRAG